jgi:hypothetical protein
MTIRFLGVSRPLDYRAFRWDSSSYRVGGWNGGYWRRKRWLHMTLIRVFWLNFRIRNSAISIDTKTYNNIIHDFLEDRS